MWPDLEAIVLLGDVRLKFLERTAGFRVTFRGPYKTYIIDKPSLQEALWTLVQVRKHEDESAATTGNEITDET